MLWESEVFAVYFPGTGDPENEVDVLYERLDAGILQARRKRYHCIVAGDFNAQVGQLGDFDDACFRKVEPW